jgi:UDP-2,3-diacylglucosamine pyrophosphatase LpxH
MEEVTITENNTINNINIRDVDTIIISDVHLGSPVSRSKQLIEMLESFKFNRLILLGDIFDDLNFKRLSSTHWKFLSYLRKISHPEKNIEIIWVEGNHDEGLSEIISVIIGIPAYTEFEWEHQGNRILAIHGHQWDRFLNENVLISKIAASIYLGIQKFGKTKQRISRFVKRRSKRWLRLSGKVASGAIDYAKNKGANVVICGHTHHIYEKQDKGVSYYNSGCWTDVPSSCVVIEHNGDIKVEQYS